MLLRNCPDHLGGFVLITALSVKGEWDKEMGNQSLLVFSLQGLLMAVDVFAVREILWLMEITPLEETPPYMTGVINLRGKIIPVIDLNLRFGHAPQRYHLTDSVMVVGIDEVPIGLIVNDVREVINISAEDVEASPLAHLEVKMPPQFVTKVVTEGGNIIMILNHENLLRDSALEEEVILEEPPGQTPLKNYFCPESSPEEREIFHARARDLMQAALSEGLGGLVPMAVVGLSGEYFGVDLELVEGFADIHNLTLVPCCPGHVVGNMNLRGHVLTLLDIRNLLDMPSAVVNSTSKVIVARMGDLSAGVVVDQVYDIVYLNPSDLGPIPSAIQKVSEKYLKGTALYGGRAMTILNLQNILTSDSLIVNEEV